MKATSKRVKTMVKSNDDNYIKKHLFYIICIIMIMMMIKKKKTCEMNMNILQSVTSHIFSRPTDTFQAMSQILEYFKLIEIIMFEKTVEICYIYLKSNKRAGGQTNPLAPP